MVKQELPQYEAIIKAHPKGWLCAGDKIEFMPKGEGDSKFDAFAVVLDELFVETPYAHIWNVSDSQGNILRLEEREGSEGQDTKINSLDDTYELPQEFCIKPMARTHFGERILTIWKLPRENMVSHRMKHRDLSPEAVTVFVRALAKALTELHRQGKLLLFFDPECIFLDENGDIKILLAHRVVKKKAFTRTPYYCGGFCAPELYFANLKSKVGEQTDVFALAACLYFLISGVPSPVCEQSSFTPVLCPRAFRYDFPIGWDELVMQGMERLPKNRPKSVERFMKEFEELYEKMCARAASSSAPEYSLAVETHIGLTKSLRYPVNQDAVLILRDDTRKRYLMVVADGVSTASYGSGDIASHMLTDYATEKWHEAIQKDTVVPENLIRDVINGTNVEVSKYIERNYASQLSEITDSMGTTALLAYVEGNDLTLGSIGDSRAYLLNEDGMFCITREHNLFTMSIVEGYPVEELMQMRGTEALTRCVGLFEINAMNQIEVPELPVDIFKIKLSEGDTLLLTTDGLIDYAASTLEKSEKLIYETIMTEPDVGMACLQLIVLANKGGGGDNIGVGLIRAHKREE